MNSSKQQPTFITDDFLLQSDFAKTMYHEYAKNQPIIDYHNHLIPEQIANNQVFDNITQVWLKGDHYKWRAMRTLGVSEDFILDQHQMLISLPLGQKLYPTPCVTRCITGHT